jgi:hypothetical protein
MKKARPYMLSPRAGRTTGPLWIAGKQAKTD